MITEYETRNSCSAAGKYVMTRALDFLDEEREEISPPPFGMSVSI
jgi:hypothetical protein